MIAVRGERLPAPTGRRQGSTSPAERRRIAKRPRRDVPVDLILDIYRLIDHVDRDVRVVQPRLRHRFQVDRHGLALSTHRLLGDGEEISFDFHTPRHRLAQVLGAIYAVERLEPVIRHDITPVLQKAMRWRGPVGSATIAPPGGHQLDHAQQSVVLDRMSDFRVRKRAA